MMRVQMMIMMLNVVVFHTFGFRSWEMVYIYFTVILHFAGNLPSIYMLNHAIKKFLFSIYYIFTFWFILFTLFCTTNFCALYIISFSVNCFRWCFIRCNRFFLFFVTCCCCFFVFIFFWYRFFFKWFCVVFWKFLADLHGIITHW